MVVYNVALLGQNSPTSDKPNQVVLIQTYTTKITEVRYSNHLSGSRNLQPRRDARNVSQVLDASNS